MKRLSLQWRITLMTVLLIGITCVAMNLLLCSSGVYYMDTIADSLQGGGTVILNDGGAASFDPQLIAPNEELTIVVDGVQGRFRTTNWYITAAVTLLSGILAYFVSGRALKPLRSFTSQVEQVQLNNLADMRIDEDTISEFRQLSRSFNQMLERLNNAFSAQRQFTGNAAHELRTPLALMQAQLELFTWKFSILLSVIALSVLFYRPFCKWLCPLGAFYALFNRVSLFQMKVDKNKCVSCGKCARACKMDVDVTKTPNHTECIRCGMCTRACPTNAVCFRYGFGDGKEKENAATLRENNNKA